MEVRSPGSPRPSPLFHWTWKRLMRLSLPSPLPLLTSRLLNSERPAHSSGPVTRRERRSALLP